MSTEEKTTAPADREAATAAGRGIPPAATEPETAPAERRRGRLTRAPWWAAALGATAVVAAGAALGYFAWAIVVGCVVAALVAERKAFFTVVAQPPLVTAAVGAGAVVLGKPTLSAAFELSTAFPHLVGAMVAVTLVVGVRVLRTR